MKKISGQARLIAKSKQLARLPRQTLLAWMRCLSPWASIEISRAKCADPGAHLWRRKLNMVKSNLVAPDLVRGLSWLFDRNASSLLSFAAQQGKIWVQAKRHLLTPPSDLQPNNPNCTSHERLRNSPSLYRFLRLKRPHPRCLLIARAARRPDVVVHQRGHESI